MKKLLSVLSVFALAAIAAGTASAGPILQTPNGLKKGDQFRFVFVTNNKTNPISDNISTYDQFVTRSAHEAIYCNEYVKWNAIVSTSNVNARDHIGIPLNPGVYIPIYMPDGTKVSSGALFGTEHDSPINQDIEGYVKPSNLNPAPFTHEHAVWTGTTTTGISGWNNYYMGGGPLYIYGSVNSTNSNWVQGTTGPFEFLPLFGISESLTVCPEPSTVMLAGLGGLAAWAYSFKRKRNS